MSFVTELILILIIPHDRAPLPNGAVHAVILAMSVLP